MKHLLIVLTGLTGAMLTGAIAPIAPAFAQTVAQTVGSVPVAVQSRSELLITEPVSMERSSEVVRPGAVVDAARLNRIANSIQTKPGQANSEGSVLPSNLIPKDLIRTRSKLLPDSHPLEMFQGYNPDPTLGINLNRL